MTRLRRVSIVAGASALLHAQTRAGEWTTTAGDAQRTAWVRADARLTKEAVQEGQFSFLWKMKLDNQSRQWSSLSEPILLERLIGYRGFKALGFVGGSADRLFAVDTDLARPYWTTHLTYAAATGGQPPSSWECPGGLLATPSRRTTLAPSAFGGGSDGGGGSGARSAVGEPGKGAAVLSEIRPSAVASAALPVAPGDVAPPVPASNVRAPIAFGGVDPLYVMGSDGLLRTLRVSDGTMTGPMVPFLPPSARPSSLTFIDGVIYTSTSHGCGGAPNGVWALDLTAANTVTTWRSGGAQVAGSAGPSFGTDGTIYVATTTDASTPAGPYANSVVALDRATLRPKHWLATDGADFNASPVLFKHKDHELAAVSGSDGRVYLLDTASLGGADHRTPLHVTAKYSVAGQGGGLATWEDDEGTRWIAASVGGSIVVFTLVDAGGRPTLAPAWRSPSLVSPLAPLVVNGMVFAVSSGQRSGPARLYVLDAASGKLLWNSRLTITSTARARMAAGSGQVYVVTDDNHLYAFGIPMEH